MELLLKKYCVFLHTRYLLLKQHYQGLKRWILKIQNKAIVGVSTKEFCLKEELIFPEEKFVMPEYRDVFGKAHKFFEAFEVAIPPFYVRSFKDGICYTNREEVYISPNQVVSEYTAEKVNPMIGTKFLDRSKIKRIKGTAAHLSLSGLEGNYYHWILECLGRLYLIEKSSFKPDYYIISTEFPFQRKYLELLGIDPKKIISAESGQLIQADELIIPTFLNSWEPVRFRGCLWCQKQYLPQWIGNLYEDKILSNIKKTEKKRIYISRRDTRHRKIINEDELISLLNEYGFETYYPEKMDVIDQIELFVNAEIVVTIIGAALGNMLFCPPKTKFLVIYTEYMHDTAFTILAKIASASYHYLIGKTTDTSKNVQLEDVYVDINEFRKALEIVINKT